MEVLREPNHVLLKYIPDGECFLHENTLYLKTSERELVCVEEVKTVIDLEKGTVCQISEDEFVIPMDAKVVYQP